MSLNIQPITGRIGATVKGVRVTDLSDEQFAELNQALLKHKALFFRSSWASYGTAARGTLRMAPPDHRVEALRDDYAKMQEMFFGEPPAFDAMIASLREWEAVFNQA